MIVKDNEAMELALIETCSAKTWMSLKKPTDSTRWSRSTVITTPSWLKRSARPAPRSPKSSTSPDPKKLRELCREAEIIEPQHVDRDCQAGISRRHGTPDQRNHPPGIAPRGHPRALQAAQRQKEGEGGVKPASLMCSASARRPATNIICGSNSRNTRSAGTRSSTSWKRSSPA